LKEIAGQPAAIRRAAAGLAGQRDALAEIRRHAAGADAILFTGMGSSYDACYAPVTQLAEQGVRAAMVDSAELLHFRLAQVTGRTLVVAVSQSGESAELVRLADSLRARAQPPVLVAITNGAQNTLAEKATIGLDTHAGEELGPSTMTFAAALVVLAAIAGDGDRTMDAADRMDALLERPEDDAAELATWYGERPVVTLLGRGCARAAAEMGALTLKEAARFPAESLQAAQFRHGPLELAGPAMAAMVFSTAAATRALDLGMADELRSAGAQVLMVGPADAELPGAPAIVLSPLSDCLAPAVAVIPTQLLAWSLARRRGLDPGGYSLASKVTERE
jgi:glucosamine--fructose-6-phosphate aminotransferase (isomerizing)